MVLPRPVPAGRRSLSLLAVGLVGCSRPSIASLVPALEIGLSARHRLHASSGAHIEADQRWDTVALVALRFRALNAARELPVRGELAPETWIAPCDSDDVICLQESAAAETEIASALGELQ